MAQLEKRQIIIVRKSTINETNQRFHVWHPATDMIETANALKIKVEIGGMKSEDFSIVFFKNELLISGFRIGGKKEGSYHRMEIPFGEFSRKIEIPQEIDEDSIEAIYENGFLLVILPKKKPKRIHLPKDVNK
jgi:HSP20 family molecular chaperone IbpA